MYLIKVINASFTVKKFHRNFSHCFPFHLKSPFVIYLYIYFYILSISQTHKNRSSQVNLLLRQFINTDEYDRINNSVQGKTQM